MKLAIYNKDGKEVNNLEASKEWDTVPVAKQAIKDAVVHHLAMLRQGNANAKTRSEVNFSTKKPWQQKGTGRARVGTKSNPLWRKGGAAHGPRPRDFSFKVNKKVKRLAFRSALGDKVRNNQIVIFDGIKFEKPKTKDMSQWLKKIDCSRSVYFVMSDNDRNAQLSLRNIPNVRFCRAQDLNVYEIVRCNKIVVEKNAWKMIEENIFKNNIGHEKSL